MLHLIVPGLLAAEPFPADTPALRALLARGQRLARPAASGLTEALCQALGLAPPYPIAALGHGHDGGGVGAGHWLRADPIHLHLNIDKLIPVDPRLLDLNLDEASQLTASLNGHFQPDGLRFQALAPDRWYLRLARPAGIATTPLDAAVGRSIEAILPQGEESALWRRYLNEAQMLLHDHPVNRAREARGELPVNSVWFWGEGEMPAAFTATADALYADTPVAAVLAGGLNLKYGKEPQGLAALEGDMTTMKENIVVVLTGLSPPAGTPSDRETVLQRYEQRWFAPLLKALQRGRIAEAIVSVTGTQALELRLTRRAAWRLWRR